MTHESPGLFELDVDAPARPQRSQRGRRRETWSWVTTATVFIRDREAIDDAFAEQEETSVVLGETGQPGQEDEQALGPMDRLAWLLWPTAGMDAALEADAFRILSAEVEVLEDEDEDDRGELRWTVTVQLREVDALRRLAIDSCPQHTESINDSLAAAWQRAVDPFAPIREVPGIDWQPGTVEGAHVPARASRQS